MHSRFTCVIPKDDLLNAIGVLIEEFDEGWTAKDVEKLKEYVVKIEGKLKEFDS
jgi:hypothetical protein